MARWLPEAFGLDEINQAVVDFVIPRLDADLPLCIDPFLLYKSRRPELQQAHGLMVSLFNDAFAAFRSGDIGRIQTLIDFPEVPEIRFGYARASVAGHGVGPVLSHLVIRTLENSPLLVERGLRHVEELQLLGLGIAEDRICDISAGIMKQFFITYTQDQCRKWNIPVTDAVPLRHVWDLSERRWTDEHVSIPIDPETRLGILLVPRWIVRRLPWINYQDYLRSDLAAFLKSNLRGQTVRTNISKHQAVAISTNRLDIVDTYIARKERDAYLAQPDAPPLLALTPVNAFDGELVQRLLDLPKGRQHAYEYQHLIFQLLNSLLEPELIDGQEQVRTISGVEIRDLIYANNSDRSFLRYLMQDYHNFLVVFECKNVQSLEIDDINQVANYLGDNVGYCGFIVTREPPSERIVAKARTTYNRQHPRKAIIILSDEDLRAMAEMKNTGVRHPVEHLQRKYREFIQAIE